MPLRRQGWPDAHHLAHLRWLSDREPFLKPPSSGLLLVLLLAVPLSDGSDAIVDPSDGEPACAVTFSAPRQDPAHGGHAHTWYTQPLADPSWHISGNPDVEGAWDFQCWAVADAATGEVVYVGQPHHIRAAYGKVLSLPAASFKVYAEHPTA